MRGSYSWRVRALKSLVQAAADPHFVARAFLASKLAVTKELLPEIYLSSLLFMSGKSPHSLTSIGLACLFTRLFELTHRR